VTALVVRHVHKVELLLSFYGPRRQFWSKAVAAPKPKMARVNISTFTA